MPYLEENFWYVALASVGDAVIVTDTRGRVVFLNRVAEQLCGWDLSEAKDRPLPSIFQVVNEKTRHPAENPVEKVLRDGLVTGLANHTVLISRQGIETAIDDSAAPILDDGKVTGVVLVFRDVADRRRIDELNERLAAIVESSDDIIATKDLQGRFTSWNPGAERVLGYSAAEMIGRHVSTIIPEEQREDTVSILDRIRRGERVDHYETRRRTKDGRIIDVSLTVSPIRDRSGAIIGASKIGRDITLQKTLERERLEADRRKDEFLAMLAHELRNPLASIGNAAHLLGDLKTEEELGWAKNVITRQVAHLVRLIDDLLDVSRISRGKIDLRVETLDLAPLVRSAVESVQPLLDERQHKLDVSLAPGGLVLDADPVRLEQILMNLLTNSARYTPAGGWIWLSARREMDNVVVSVRDSGIGISRELLPKVFELFVQGERDMARAEGGLGIGLTLVQKLTQMHGGTVTAHSGGRGQGSEFVVRLPAAPADSARTKSSVSLPPLPSPTARVLVVDDNQDAARTLAKLLSMLGHEVRLAFDGQTALKTARLQRPEIILLDIGLPDKDGYDVARELRREECCKSALIIAISGYGQEEDLRRSQAAGFDHHLVKPVDRQVLTMLVSTARGETASSKRGADQ